jgi:hypothetical protein
MKTLTLLFILSIFSLTAFAQNEKCLALSTKIVENVKGKILCHDEDEDLYCMKAEFPATYNLETIKTICDTTAKNIKVSYKWKINYDKNDEKEFIVSGHKLLVTIYFDEKFLYFEFPRH